MKKILKYIPGYYAYKVINCDLIEISFIRYFIDVFLIALIFGMFNGYILTKIFPI